MGIAQLAELAQLIALERFIFNQMSQQILYLVRDRDVGDPIVSKVLDPCGSTAGRVRLANFWM